MTRVWVKLILILPIFARLIVYKVFIASPFYIYILWLVNDNVLHRFSRFNLIFYQRRFINKIQWNQIISLTRDVSR